MKIFLRDDDMDDSDMLVNLDVDDFIPFANRKIPSKFTYEDFIFSDDFVEEMNFHPPEKEVHIDKHHVLLNQFKHDEDLFLATMIDNTEDSDGFSVCSYTNEEENYFSIDDNDTTEDVLDEKILQPELISTNHGHK